MSKFFESEHKKNKNSANIFKRGKNFKKESTKSDRMMEGMAIWTSYYRANPHRFVKDYLGIELKLFQQILLFAMMHFNFVTYIASRGLYQLALLIGNFKVIKSVKFGG